MTSQVRSKAIFFGYLSLLASPGKTSAIASYENKADEPAWIVPGMLLRTLLSFGEDNVIQGQEVKGDQAANFLVWMVLCTLRSV